jgi:hypothetical protein
MAASVGMAAATPSVAMEPLVIRRAGCDGGARTLHISHLIYLAMKLKFFWYPNYDGDGSAHAAREEASACSDGLRHPHACGSGVKL